MIARTEYLDQLSALKDKHIIKVITGIRRCGKSTLLELFRERLTGEGIPADRMVSINFEDMDNSALRNPESLHAHIKAKLIPGKTTYVFLDEVQNVVDFPRVVNSLFTRKNIDIYLTGSNAFMLSGDLATLLSGRYIEIKMLPLSFREYVQGVGTTEPPSRLFKHYLTEGGMPNALEFRNNAKTRFDYLSGIYSTVVLKDIAQHMKIGDTMMLERVIRFVFDNVGNTLSTKKIADTLTSDGRKADHKTVERYLHAMMSSFIVYQARRFDVKGKQYLKTQEKYYAVDTGLRHTLLGNRNTDWGHLLENVVYLELFRRGYAVYIGKVGTTEIDFVAQRGAETVYYQVAATLRSPETLERELRPLRAISDNYPKFIITLDDDPAADFAGIRTINAMDFLLGLPGL